MAKQKFHKQKVKVIEKIITDILDERPEIGSEALFNAVVPQYNARMEFKEILKEVNYIKALKNLGLEKYTIH